MPKEKYLSLDEAAEKLGLTEDELKKYREDAKIRGFAERGNWKFRESDVTEFKSTLQSMQQKSSGDMQRVLSLKLKDAEAPAVDEDVDHKRSETSKAVEEAENIFIGNPEYFSNRNRVAGDLKKFSQMGKLCPVDALSVGLPQKNADTSIMSYSIYTFGGNEPVDARQYLEAAAVYYKIITEKERKSKVDVSLRKLDETLLRLKLFALGKPIEDIAGFHSGPAKQAVVAPPDETLSESPPVVTGDETLTVETPAAPPPVESPAVATATTPQNIFNNNTVVMGGAESKKEKKKRKKEMKRREKAEAGLVEAVKIGVQTLEEQRGEFKDFVDQLQAEHNDALAKESQAAKDAAEAFDAERLREAASRNNTHSSDLNPEEARVVLAFLRDYSPLFTNATSFSVDENDHVVAVFFPGVTADMRVGDVNWPSNDAIPFTDNYRKSKDKYPPPDMFIPGSDFERQEDLVGDAEAVARTTPILPSTAGWGPANSPVRRTAEQTRHRFNTIHGAGSMMHNMMNHLTTDRSNGGAFPPTTNPTQRTAPQPAPRQQNSATDNTPKEAGVENAQRGAA